MSTTINAVTKYVMVCLPAFTTVTEMVIDPDNKHMNVTCKRIQVWAPSDQYIHIYTYIHVITSTHVTSIYPHIYIHTCHHINTCDIFKPYVTDSRTLKSCALFRDNKTISRPNLLRTYAK